MHTRIMAAACAAVLTVAAPVARAASPEVFVTGGAGLGRGGSLGAANEWYDADGVQLRREDRYPSAGQGSALTLGLAWPLSPRWQLRVEAARRTPNTQTYALTAPGDYFNPEYDETLTGRIAQTGVTVVVRDPHRVWTPYAGAGATLAWMTTHSTYHFNRYGDLVTVHWTAAHRAAIGVHGVAGVTCQAGAHWAPFAEAAFEQLSFARRRLTVHDATAFGIEIPFDIDPYTEGEQRVVDYVQDDIAHAAPPVVQASSVTLRVGTAFRF